MGFVIVIGCVSVALNLALWASLYMRLDGLPLRIWCLLKKKERSDLDASEARVLPEPGKGGAR